MNGKKVSFMDMFANMTLKCRVCDKDRPIQFINVISHDVSLSHALKPETLFINVRHCSDNKECIEKAQNYQSK